MKDKKNTNSVPILPLHKPKEDIWKQIANHLDASEFEIENEKHWRNLPKHSPSSRSWHVIQQSIKQGGFAKINYRTIISVAASIALIMSTFFLINKPNNFKEQTQKNNSKESKNWTQKELQVQENRIIKANPSLISSKLKKTRNNYQKARLEHFTEKILGAEETSQQITNQADTFVSKFENSQNHNAETLKADELRKHDFQDQKLKKNQTTYIEPKYFGLNENRIQSSRPLLGVEVNYLPENISIGEGKVVFKRYDLTASYTKEKFRYQASIGIAYCENPKLVNVDYVIEVPVFGTGPNSKNDTVSIEFSNKEINLKGTEKHEYLSYQIGLARQIYTIGKFSSWVNAGVGIGMKLNQSDFAKTAANSVKDDNTAKVKKITTNNSHFSDFNIHISTSIDFALKAFKKVSFSVSPTAYWDLKPLITKNYIATDDLSIGFRTGIKIDI